MRDNIFSLRPNIIESFTRINNIMQASKVKGISLYLVFFRTVRGNIRPENPKTSKVLDILLPIMFPNTISLCPSILENILITSSGTEVPKATTVNPITISEIASFLANEEDPLTSKSAPLTSNIKPMIRNTNKYNNVIMILYYIVNVGTVPPPINHLLWLSASKFGSILRRNLLEIRNIFFLFLVNIPQKNK